MKKFIAPELEVVSFEVKDVITASDLVNPEDFSDAIELPKV